VEAPLVEVVQEEAGKKTKIIMKFDITILTEACYVNPTERDQYIDNVMLEDELIIKQLEAKGLKVHRTNWDNPDFDFTTTKYVLFRAIWDYFDRFPEFSKWIEEVSQQTKLINPAEQIVWNMDKHYLKDLEDAGINIVNTNFIEIGDTRTLSNAIADSGWEHVILKPAVSGGARHTYKIKPGESNQHEAIYKELIAEEAMLIQPFINSIMDKGEVSFMVFGGKYSHAVLKKAKAGDFRVQDDHGGTVHHYEASAEEIEFVQNVMVKCKTVPVYGRVDVAWDNDGELALVELEIIEPELWFRESEKSSVMLADAVMDFIA
jgi:glutathione synthase/RimK-type ligase-like ATP-grasp enzyme